MTLAPAVQGRAPFYRGAQELAQTLNHCVLGDSNESGLTIGWHGHKRHMLACFGT